MSDFKYCLVQYLAMLVDTRKHKEFLDCEDCPIKEKCKKAEKEVYNEVDN